MTRFDTYMPCEQLKPYVKFFAVSETDEEKTYKVLADTGVVIGFQYKGRLAQLVEGKPVLLEVSGLTGIHDGFRTFHNFSGTGTVLVYLKEASAPVFFKQPVNELFRQSVSLEQFMLRSELVVLEEQLAEASDDQQRISLVEQFLITRMDNTLTDTLVVNALTLIHKSKGTIKMKELMDKLHTSQSPLEKRFRKIVGASPKKFASIVRFKHTIENYNPANSLADLGYASGFYDQSHFIKEFKLFTGETPEHFFK